MTRSANNPTASLRRFPNSTSHRMRSHRARPRPLNILPRMKSSTRSTRIRLSLRRPLPSMSTPRPPRLLSPSISSLPSRPRPHHRSLPPRRPRPKTSLPRRRWSTPRSIRKRSARLSGCARCLPARPRLPSLRRQRKSAGARANSPRTRARLPTRTCAAFAPACNRARASRRGHTTTGTFSKTACLCRWSSSSR